MSAAALETESVETRSATRSPVPVWLQPWLVSIEEWLNYVGDYLNPIVVKETRQALKSRQFVFTFVALLVACWLITIIGVAMIGPGIYYSASGGVLLQWYYYVLLFPLAVIVPFTAFRSLLTEKEDNTYDLLTVTTLSPRRIVNGKLSSAMIQIGVYFSAIAPCIAFTYLLRGIDVLTIALLLALAVLGSIGLSMVGLVFAAAAKQKYGQTLISVAFVTLLLICFSMALGGATAFLLEGMQFVQDWEFWVVLLMIATLYTCLFASSYFAAIAMITFSAANRSTPLRWTMLLHQVCWIGWIAFIVQLESDEQEIPVIGFLMAAVYWFVVGTLLTAEPPIMSERVRRALPQSLLGRVTLSWLAPGSGTGFGFALANLTVLLALAVPTTIYFGNFTWGKGLTFCYVAAMLIAWAYAVVYLGLGRLFVGFLRKYSNVSLLAGFLVSLILVIFGTLAPVVIQSSSRTWQNAGYTWLQVTNPFWSTMNILERRADDDALWLLPLTLGVAACVILLNLMGMARELRQTRVALPGRVVEDEAELHPVVAHATSPWDQPETD